MRFGPSQTLTAGYYGAQLHVERTAQFFFVAFLLMSLIVGIAVGLAGLLIFIFLSHRIAGPLYRFEQSLEEVANGNLKHRFNLRQKDQLSDLAQHMNILFDVLDKKLGSLKKEINAAAKEDSPAKLKESLGRLKEILDSFKTSS
jgi:nitrogen fixation/metabolism regulation signal transduction histidine kinase